MIGPTENCIRCWQRQFTHPTDIVLALLKDSLQQLSNDKCVEFKKCKGWVINVYEAQKRFAISEVANDLHELMLPQHIMRLFIVRASEELGPWYNVQTTTPQSSTQDLHPIAR